MLNICYTFDSYKQNENIMKSPKITKSQIVTGASFELKNGTYNIIEVQKDGYKKGQDRIKTEFKGISFADGYSDVLYFINAGRK